MGSTASRQQSHYKEEVYFLLLSCQKFLELIWSTLEGWKVETTFKPPSGFEHETPGLGIHCLNHLANICSAWKIKQKIKI